MERVTIVGLGQIGASIGMAIKRAKPQGVEVVGVDREPEVSARARKMGAVDRVFHNVSQAAEEASLLILAVPVGAIREVMGVVAPVLEEGTIVTDTGSTKAAVLMWAEEILPASTSFIGGHPMVGSEVTGVDGARADLFDGAIYCLVPSPRADPTAVKGITNLVSFLGSKPFFVDAVEHDGLVASVSHLPIALSITLMNTVRKAVAWREMGRLAAGSFRDVSRLASGDPEMHRDIFLTNPEGVVHWIDEYIAELRRLQQQIQDREEGELLATLRGALRGRDWWLQGKYGADEELEFEELDSTFGDQMEQLFLGGKAARLLREITRRRKR